MIKEFVYLAKREGLPIDEIILSNKELLDLSDALCIMAFNTIIQEIDRAYSKEFREAKK